MPRNLLEEANLALKKNCERFEEVSLLIENEKTPTADQMKSWNEELDGLKKEHPALKTAVIQIEDNEKHRNSTKSLLSFLNESQDPMRFALGSGGRLTKRPSDQLLENEGIKAWTKSHMPTGSAQNGVRIPDSPNIHLEGSVKTLFTGTSTLAAPSDVSSAAMVRPTFRGLVDETLYQIPLGIADMVTHEKTDSDLIFYARIPTTTSGTQAAVPVAEATATGDGSGTKPEGALAFEIKEAVVRTIAVWIAVTRKALANAPQLQGVIDRYLRYEVMRDLSKEIITGDNTGEHLLGVTHLPGILSQVYDGQSVLTTARKAITNIILNGRTIPTAWCMHPTDFESFDLQTDNEQRYYFGGPGAGGGYAYGGAGELTGRVPTLWGIPVRQSEFVAVGTAILADWTRYIVADREETTVRVSDSNQDFFIRNLLAVLCEIRVAGYAERDQAFETVALS